jgi:hypothetical protein
VQASEPNSRDDLAWPDMGQHAMNARDAMHELVDPSIPPIGKDSQRAPE